MLQELTTNFSSVSPKITEDNFPPSETIDVVNRIFKFDSKKLTQEILSEIDEQGFRVATLYEVLNWAKTEWNRKDAVVALGSLWHEFVPYIVLGCCNQRILTLRMSTEIWSSYYNFAAIKK